MPELTEAELKKQLAAGELCGVYLIAGEEKYLVKRSASRLVKKAAGEAFPEFNRNEFGNDSSIDSIADAVLALPFSRSTNAFLFRISMWRKRTR